jgi:hypothetical protein
MTLHEPFAFLHVASGAQARSDSRPVGVRRSIGQSDTQCQNQNGTFRPPRSMSHIGIAAQYDATTDREALYLLYVPCLLLGAGLGQRRLAHLAYGRRPLPAGLGDAACWRAHQKRQG